MQFDVSSQLPELNEHLTQIYTTLNGDLTPLMNALGAYGESSTRERFATKKAPDGTSWAQLAPSTLKAKKGRGGILVNRGDLMRSITYATTDATVAIGTPESHGKYQQAGTIHMPARVIFGLSQADREGMGDIINEFVAGVLNG